MSKASAKRQVKQTKADAQALIGCHVEKWSGKPFKSAMKINTVRAVVEHPQRPGGGLAFTFAEDDSVVAVEMCRKVE